MKKAIQISFNCIFWKKTRAAAAFTPMQVPSYEINENFPKLMHFGQILTRKYASFPFRLGKTFSSYALARLAFTYII